MNYDFEFDPGLTDFEMRKRFGVFRHLIGHRIDSIRLTDGGDLEVVTATAKFLYTPEGDCCAHAYILAPDPDSVKLLLGARVVRTSEKEWTPDQARPEGVPRYDEVLDVHFYSIESHSGDLEIEMRVEHNGYYGGWINDPDITSLDG